VSEYERAQQLDPRDATGPGKHRHNLLAATHVERGTSRATHALAVDARESGGMISLLNSCLNGTGDIKEARRIMSTFPSENRITLEPGAPTSST